MSGPAPRVSVLMTCHDAAATIEESVRSVIAQTFTDWELVLVDDLSTDDSLARVARLGDPRVQIVRLDTRHRRTRALNAGLRRVRGEYVAVLDADDLAAPERLARQVAMLDARPELAGVGSWFVDIDAAGRETRRHEFDVEPIAVRRQLAHNCLLVHSAMTYRTGLARLAGAYDERYDYAQDFALWIALARTHELGAIPAPLTRIRRLDSSMSRGRDYAMDLVRDGVRLYARAQTLPGLRPSDRVRGLRTIAWYAALLVWRTLRRR
jgi:glycosyltransferase involved in cell wall biosynthesis